MEAFEIEISDSAWKKTFAISSELIFSALQDGLVEDYDLDLAFKREICIGLYQLAEELRSRSE